MRNKITINETISFKIAKRPTSTYGKEKNVRNKIENLARERSWEFEGAKS
jgi:hypothetical protein